MKRLAVYLRWSRLFGFQHIKAMRGGYAIEYALMMAKSESKKSQLTEIIGGTSECLALCERLFPEEIAIIRHRPVGEFIAWITEKTGVVVDGGSPAGFAYWLPRLREMAADQSA